jgi:nucleoid DNA-binding protein
VYKLFENHKESKMTKKELVQVVSTNVGITQVEADKVLSEISKCIMDECHNGRDITIPGIGKFSRKHRPARKVRNPRTGETMMSKPKNVPVFKASSTFKAGLN